MRALSLPMCSRCVLHERSRIRLAETGGVLAMQSDQKRARRVVRLSERRRGIRTAHCPRCERRVALRLPWRGWRYVRYAWFCVLAALLPLLPAIAFDACVMMPAFMLFLTAIGPLNALARRPPACRRCGLPLGGPPGSPATGVQRSATVLRWRSGRGRGRS